MRQTEGKKRTMATYGHCWSNHHRINVRKKWTDRQTER